MAEIGPLSWEGGLNSKGQNYNIYPDFPKNQYADALNMQIIGDHITKRRGSGKWESTAHPNAGNITGLSYDFKDSKMIAVSGTKIASSSQAGWTDITGAVTITTGSKINTSSLNSLFIVTTSFQNSPIKWSGSGNAAVLGGSPPSGKVNAVVNGYLFIGNTSANPSRIQWSNVQDPETWPAANFIDFNKADGDTITAMIGMADYLIVFKKRSMAKFWTGGLTLGPLTIVSNKFGCADMNCVDLLPDGRICFLSTDTHVYIYDGSQLTDISDPPYPYSNVQDLLGNFALTTTYMNVRVYKKRNQVWICNETGDSQRGIFVYDYNTNVWQSKFTRTISYSVTEDGSGNLVTGSANGFIYQQDFTDILNDEDGGSGFDGYATKRIVLGSDNLSYVPNSALFPVITTSMNGTVYYGFNQVAVGGFTGTNATSFFVNGTVSQFKKFSVPIKNRGKTYDLTIRFDSPNSNQLYDLGPISLTEEVFT